MNRRIVVGVGIGLVVTAAVIVAFSTRFGIDPEVTTSPLIGTPAPSWTAPELDTGTPFSTAELEGEIVVVNFWASWCTGCRVEHAALTSAAAAFAEFDVSFVGVLYQDDPQRGREFLEELGRSDATVYVVDEQSRIGLDFGVFGLPETFFIDRSGTIVAKKTGAISPTEINTVLQQMILGESVGRLEPGEVFPVG